MSLILRITYAFCFNISEDAKMKEMLNFRALAKEVTNLTKHENIADILGVALEDGTSSTLTYICMHKKQQ